MLLTGSKYQYSGKMTSLRIIQRTDVHFLSNNFGGFEKIRHGVASGGQFYHQVLMLLIFRLDYQFYLNDSEIFFLAKTLNLHKLRQKKSLNHFDKSKLNKKSEALFSLGLS